MAVWATLTMVTWRWVGRLRVPSLSDLLRVERASNPSGRRLVGTMRGRQAHSLY